MTWNTRYLLTDRADRELVERTVTATITMGVQGSSHNRDVVISRGSHGGGSISEENPRSHANSESQPKPTRTDPNQKEPRTRSSRAPPIQSQLQEAIALSVLTPVFFFFYEALGPAEVGVEVSAVSGTI